MTTFRRKEQDVSTPTAKRGPTARTDLARARAREKFLKRLAETCNVSDAARVAGIARSIAYDWKAADSAFEQAWNEAIETARDALEAEARRRAVEGWKEPIFQGGRQVGEIHRYSDRMLEVLLKGHRPQFREKGVEVDVGVTLQSPPTFIDVARRLHHIFAQAAKPLPDPSRAEVVNALVVPATPITDGQLLPAQELTASSTEPPKPDADNSDPNVWVVE
jgi:hypothetical protein